MSKDDIEPGSRKILTAHRFPVPTCIRELRGFIRLASYISVDLLRVLR